MEPKLETCRWCEKTAMFARWHLVDDHYVRVLACSDHRKYAGKGALNIYEKGLKTIARISRIHNK